MPTKPSSPATVDGAHAYAPVHCFLMNENSGRPGDIGTAALPAGTGGIPTWASDSDIGIISRWNGTTSCDYGISATGLAGLTKFTAVFSMKPTAWAQGIIFRKLDTFVIGGGVNDPPFGGANMYFQVGPGAGPLTNYLFQSGGFDLGAQHQFIMSFDSSRAAGDRIRLWRDTVQVAKSFSSDDVATVPTNANAIALGLTYSGDIGYLYLIPNLVPSVADIQSLFTAPYQFVNGALAVVSIAGATDAVTGAPSAYRHSVIGAVPLNLTVTRIGPTGNSLTVLYTKTGLVEGTDYTLPGTSVVIAVGQTTAPLSLNPLPLAIPKAGWDGPVTVALAADPAYDLGPTSTQSVAVRLYHVKLDQYGGDARLGTGLLTKFAGFTPLWNLLKSGNRWMFVTPEGNGCFLLGAWVMDTVSGGATFTTSLNTKYGGLAVFARQASRKLKKWGFQHNASYSTSYLYPTTMFPSSVISGVDRLPYAFQIRSSRRGRVGGTLKNIGEWINQAYVDDVSPAFRTMGDVYNSAFAAVCLNAAANPGMEVYGNSPAAINADPFCTYILGDDGDDTFGFRGGPADGHPHNGHTILITRPSGWKSVFETSYASIFDDPWVTSKLALRDFLQGRHASLAALNTAWGSSYSTWDTDHTTRTNESIEELVRKITGADAAITTGTAALSTIAAVFQSTDVGRAITVAGAGVGGGTLSTVILTFTDSTHVTLRDNANTTVSSAVYTLRRSAINDHSGDSDREFNVLAGNAVRLDFVGNSIMPMTFTPVDSNQMKNTVILKVAGVTVGTDDGLGNLTGATLASGAVNYVTGKITFTFSTGNAPASGATITVTYTGNGWGVGAGFLDEDGRPAHTWVGSENYYLAGMSAGAKTDIEAFLLAFARRYFQDYTAAIHTHYPNKLVTGPAAMNVGISGHGARDQVVQAHAEYCEFMLSSGLPMGGSSVGHQQDYAIAQRPLLPIMYFVATGDNELTNPTGFWGAPYDQANQSGRASGYQTHMTAMTTLQQNGDFFIIGNGWWEYTNHVTGGENTNFGLVSLKENAYDGVEAIIAAGTDPWGYATGGEAANRGDFISGVRQGNALAALIDSLSHAGPVIEISTGPELSPGAADVVISPG